MTPSLKVLEINLAVEVVGEEEAQSPEMSSDTCFRSLINF
jgi:hypothetical protein